MRLPSKSKGLVTTATVRMPISLAISATTGAAPVPVPPPMPAVMKTMCAPFERLGDALALLGRGCGPLPAWRRRPDPGAQRQLDDGGLLRFSAWRRCWRDEFDALTPRAIM
jgi:hypothetical protein